MNMWSNSQQKAMKWKPTSCNNYCVLKKLPETTTSRAAVHTNVRMKMMKHCEDIEACSRLWHNTEAGETMLQTLPFKVVGLLRPSTMLEEGNDESWPCTETSSQHSEQTAAHKEVGGSVATSETSSCHETAYKTRMKI